MRWIGTVITMALLISGCSTFSETFDTRNHCGSSLVYCGTRTDTMLIAAAGDESAGILRAFVPLAIMDLPFSFVADTLLLPYTVSVDAFGAKSQNAEPLRLKATGGWTRRGSPDFLQLI